MPLWSLTLEEKEEILKKRDEKVSTKSHIALIPLPLQTFVSMIPGFLAVDSGAKDVAGENSKRPVD